VAGFSGKDMSDALALIDDAHSAEDPEEYAERVVDGLAHLVPGEVVGYNEREVVSHRLLTACELPATDPPPEVVDAVGGANMERLLRILKPGGALFLVNPLGFADHDEAHRRGIVVSSTQVRSNGAQLAEAGRLLDDGTVRVAIDSQFPLMDAAGAHARAMKGGIRGKIVLAVGRP